MTIDGVLLEDYVCIQLDSKTRLEIKNEETGEGTVVLEVLISLTPRGCKVFLIFFVDVK